MAPRRPTAAELAAKATEEDEKQSPATDIETEKAKDEAAVEAAESEAKSGDTNPKKADKKVESVPTYETIVSDDGTITNYFKAG